MLRSLAAVLLLSSYAAAEPVAEPSESWQELRSKNLHMGLSEERVERTLEACRKNKLSLAEAEDLLTPVYAAHAEQLPTDCVFLKIEEGLAKQIAWQDVHVAADHRLDCLRQAARLIDPILEGRGGNRQHLIMHTCMALESGLPAEILQEVFARPERLRFGRLTHVIEAGEFLALEGLAPEDIGRLMKTCIERDLNRAEIFRAVDFVLAEHHAGKPFTEILSSLWVN